MQFIQWRRSALSAAFVVLVWVGRASGEIEAARDLMEEGKFVEAREALWPAARSGNAEAEELIGVMYAMGLGVKQDYQRAFEWYLRSAMKGHAGAQSGVGWYYEVGLGMPAIDLTRAYMWYVLSAMGLFPISGSDRYWIGVPLFERITVQLPGGELLIEGGCS